MSVLTPFTDMNPVPRVLVDVPVSEFPAGSVTVSLQSTVDGRTIDVRGGQRKPASSPLIVLDPEPGFMVPTSYTLFGFDAAGKVVGSRPVGSVTVLFSGTVIQQPLDPRLSAQVELLRGTASELSRSTPGGAVYPQGRVLPGMVGLGPRRGLQGIPLLLDTLTDDAAVALDATLGTYDTPQLPVWLVRTVPDGHLPRRLFCHVPELVKHDTFLGLTPGRARFSTVVTEIKPPAAGIAATGLTYADVAVFFSTYSALGAAYATYSDIKRDTSLVGAADS